MNTHTHLYIYIYLFIYVEIVYAYIYIYIHTSWDIMGCMEVSYNGDGPESSILWRLFHFLAIRFGLPH